MRALCKRLCSIEQQRHGVLLCRWLSEISSSSDHLAKPLARTKPSVQQWTEVVHKPSGEVYYWNKGVICSKETTCVIMGNMPHIRSRHRRCQNTQKPGRLQHWVSHDRDQLDECLLHLLQHRVLGPSL